MAHLPEHSIELEVVLLQFLYEGKRDIRIVPLVVGSFQDTVITGGSPREMNDIGRMIEALRAVRRDTLEPICYLISGDLAHIGPKFGDEDPVKEPQSDRQQGAGPGHPARRRGGRPGGVLPRDCRRGRLSSNLRLATHVHVASRQSVRRGERSSTTINLSTRAVMRASALPAWRFTDERSQV